MKKLDVMEETKLRWPDGIERTRIKDRVKQAAWKKTRKEYFVMLCDELGKMGATRVLVCQSDNELLDPGVAVWFSMKKEDFSWQQGLALESPAPTVEQIDQAFRIKAKPVHPDNPDTGDPEMFKRLSEWRDVARAWVTGKSDHNHEHVMAIDQYAEARLNLCAIRLAFSYIRGLERVGAPSILKQTLNAFRAKLTGGSSVPISA